jgi:hypothetical protein
MYYVGGPLSHHSKAGCRVPGVSWVMARVRIWENSELLVCGFLWLLLLRAIDHEAAPLWIQICS